MIDFITRPLHFASYIYSLVDIGPKWAEGQSGVWYQVLLHIVIRDRPKFSNGFKIQTEILHRSNPLMGPHHEKKFDLPHFDLFGSDL